MTNNLEERMKKAMEENKRADELALRTLGLKSVEEFIALKLSALKLTT